jgi:hypothetical protein
MLKAIHYLDYSAYSANSAYELQKLKDENPFFPVEGLCRDLEERYQNLYQIHRNVDIDEQTIPWKGRHQCRCYMSKKPEKWHFKLFALNDSTNGYMSRFYLYKGRKKQRPGDIPATLWPYKQLITEDMRDKNYIIATDNWFTSMEAVEYILSTNNQLVGTVRKNRRNIPKRQIMNTKIKRGTIKQSKTEINGRNVFFTSWIDTKDVYFLSTFQGKKATTTRKSFNKTGLAANKCTVNCESL